MKIEVLDHGYATLIESWGSDQSIIEAARMSTDKGFRTWEPYKECETCGLWVLNNDGSLVPCPDDDNGDHSWQKKKRGDMGLLNYMWKNKHATPFEMAGLTIEVQAPILVFRQWHRHRTQSYNEMSARYTPLPDTNYVPTVERLMVNSRTNKQAGRAAKADDLTEENARDFREQIGMIYADAERIYQTALKRGVPKEVARVHLPVGRYSRMRASANLRNWLAFLTLRLDPHAQYEIRVYAEAVGAFIADRFPRTWELFNG